MSEDVKTKHLLTVKCPGCECLLDIFEEEKILVPFRKKMSEKRIIVKKNLQTTL
jgi:hypothetical protein